MTNGAFAATVLLGAVAVAVSPPMVERPPLGHSGGFGEPTCATCHIGSDVNAFGGRVGLDGLPEVYVPGREYVLTIVLEAEGTVTAGFQLAARFAPDSDREGSDAGALTPVDGRVEITDSAGITYAHQGRDGARAPGSAGSSWTVAWVAPPDPGAVVFHLAANSGNGDDSPLGDLVYVHEASTHAAPAATSRRDVPNR